MGQLPIKDMLQRLDGISNDLCRLIDTAECVHRIHPQRDMRAAALKASQQVSAFMHSLNHNRALYMQVQASAKDATASLDEAELAVLKSVLRDFELLAKSKFDTKLLQMQLNLDQATAQFEMAASRHKSDQITANVKQPKLEAASAVRALENLIKCRFAIANALDYSSASDMILSGKSFRTTEQVQTWIKEEAQRIRKVGLTSNSDRLAFTVRHPTQHIESLLKLFDLSVSFSSLPGNVLQLNLSSDQIAVGRIYIDYGNRPGKSPCPMQYTLQARIPPIQAGCVVISLPVPDLNNIDSNSMRSLYHEMGHALHNLLSKVPFQIVSGTRCVEDLVEAPSACFERIFDQSQHSKADQPTVDDLLQLQIALMDQLLHSRLPGEGLGWSASAMREAHESVGADILHNAPGSAWYAHIGHLANYGGYYYAYPLSTHLARTVSIPKLRELLGRGGLLNIEDFDFVIK